MDQPPEDLDVQLTSKSSKTPLIVVVVLVVAAVAFFAMRASKQHNERKRHAQFLDDFAQVEKKDVAAFWACVLGDKVDPAAFSDNLGFEQRISSEFGIDAKNYPTKVRDECTSKAVDARHRIEGLQAPDEYRASLQKYSESMKALEAALQGWAKIAPTQVQDMAVAQRLDKAGAAWHGYAGGKLDPDATAYDRFLHCGEPDVDKMKDGQALVERLFNDCKKAEYAKKLNEVCGKELASEMPAAPTKNWKAAVKKMGPDDRVISALGDCLKKARKAKRRDDLADVSKAWLSWLDASRAVRATGKEMLKE